MRVALPLFGGPCFWICFKMFDRARGRFSPERYDNSLHCDNMSWGQSAIERNTIDLM